MKYFIGVLLEGEAKEKFESLRAEVCRVSGSVKALMYPPHITLRPPFETDGNIDDLHNGLKEYSLHAKKFDVMSKGLNYFDHVVCFLDIEQDPRLLRIAADMDKLTAENVRTLGEFVRRPDIHFHATLAFRDLGEEGYRDLRAEEGRLEVPKLTIPVDHVALLRHDEGLWQVEATYPFGGRP